MEAQGEKDVRNNKSMVRDKVEEAQWKYLDVNDHSHLS